MAYPRRGCLVDTTTGAVSTVWEVGDPLVTLDQFLPMIHHLDGTVRPEYDPTKHVILDLDAETEPGDVSLLCKDLHAVRFRQAKNTKVWHIRQVATVTHEDGKVEDVEIDHPLETLRAARKAAKAAKKKPV